MDTTQNTISIESKKSQSILTLILLNVFSWWLVVTVLYTSSLLVSRSSVTTYTLGLFTPIGPMNFFFVLVGSFGLAPIIIILLGIVYESLAKKFLVPIYLKVIFNLVFLLVCTYVLDMIFFGKYCSLLLLLGQGCVKF